MKKWLQRMGDIKELSISTKLSQKFKINQMNFDPQKN
jgi:hypothetical protein